MGVADTTAPASFGTASDLRTAANPSAQHSADSPWLPLTTNARGIYFAAAIDPTNPCYNTAEVLQCPADTDLALLREAFEQLYRENEGFRVRTRIADGSASQQILTEEAFLAGIDLLVDGGELSGTAEAGEENASDLPESALPDSDLPAPVRAWAQRLLAQPLATDEGVPCAAQWCVTAGSSGCTIPSPTWLPTDSRRSTASPAWRRYTAPCPPVSRFRQPAA